MRSTGVWLLLLTLGIVSPAKAEDARLGMAGGRLLVRSGDRILTPGELAELTEQVPERVEARREWEVIAAGLRADGMFLLSGEPGEWRIDYLLFGHRAEFWEARAVRLDPEGVTCTGTIEVSVRDPKTDLGSNLRATRVRVIDDCDELVPSLRRLSGGREVRTSLPAEIREAEKGWRPDMLDAVLALRLGVGFERGGPRLLGSYVLPWRSLGGILTLLLVAEVGAGLDDGYAVGGAGLMLFGILEAQAGVGLGSPWDGRPGTVFVAKGRLGWDLFGLGVQLVASPDGNMSFDIFLDTSPFFLLGSFL